MLPHDGDVRSVAREAERNSFATRSTKRRFARGIKQHLLDAICRQAMLLNVLDVPILLVIHVPNDMRIHGATPMNFDHHASCC